MNKVHTTFARDISNSNIYQCKQTYFKRRLLVLLISPSKTKIVNYQKNQHCILH